VRGDWRTLRVHWPRHEDIAQGLGITEEDWNIAVKHLVATMTKFKVKEKEQKEVAAALTTLKADIVEKP
jgi:hypothetical protein